MSILLRKIKTAYNLLLRPVIYKLRNTSEFLFTGRSLRLVVNGWFRHCGTNVIRNNWGDDINYYVLSLITRRIIFNYSSIFRCTIREGESNYTCIGSVIDRFCDSRTVVWGSGVLCGDSVLKEKPARVCAVRGPLSRKNLLERGVECPEVYGDPALLLPRIVKPERKIKYKLGIVPIVPDINNPNLKSLLSQSENVKFINMMDYGNDWRLVIEDICSCECIASSSLHGLIVSDAYGVPNVRVAFSDCAAGGDFKYNDYYMSVSREMNKPIYIDENTSVDNLIEQCRKWKPITFDAQPLIDSCPFDLINI